MEIRVWLLNKGDFPADGWPCNLSRVYNAAL